MSLYSRLQPVERDRIADLKAAGMGVCAIARALKRAPSTISRELKRNATDTGAYRPVFADGAYLSRRCRLRKLDRDPNLKTFVIARLSEGWTPEQIAGRLSQGAERNLGTITTETIYAWIYCKARKAEKLWRMLPRGKARRGLPKRKTASQASDKTPISERSSDIDARQTAGHWGEEGPCPGGAAKAR